MAYEKKDGDIAIFKNDSDNEKAPSHRGEILIGGVTYEIALWTKDSQRGQFWAGSSKVKGDRTNNKPVADKSRNLNDDIDSGEIPF